MTEAVWVPTAPEPCSVSGWVGGDSNQPKIDLGKPPARLAAQLGLGLDLGLRRLGLGSPALETGRPPASPPSRVQCVVVGLYVCWGGCGNLEGME